MDSPVACCHGPKPSALAPCFARDSEQICFQLWAVSYELRACPACPFSVIAQGSPEETVKAKHWRAKGQLVVEHARLFQHQVNPGQFLSESAFVCVQFF